jgi:Ca2+/Na+ antiporter
LMDNNNSYSVNPAIWIIYIIIATLVVFLFAIKDDKYTPVIQTFILTLTLFAIVWYTIEANRMQRTVQQQVQAAVQQTNLSVLPFFVAHIGRASMDNEFGKSVRCFELENIGNGIALNVTVDPIDIELETKIDFMPAPHIVFDAVVSIPPGELKLVPHSSYINYESSNNQVPALDWMSNLTSVRAVKDYELKVRFMDILGNRYVQVIHAGRSGIWPDVVTPDTSDRQYGHPTIALVTPFTHSPMREITAKERRQLWKPRRPL